MPSGDEHRGVLLRAPLRAVQPVLQSLDDGLRHKVAHGSEPQLVQERVQLLCGSSHLAIVEEAFEGHALGRLARKLLEQRIELRLARNARSRLRVEDRLLEVSLLQPTRHVGQH
eukprot:7387927-Prymnesium_polylepis.1